MPLLLSAHLQAARAQAWAGGKGEVNGARDGAGGRHPRRGFVRGLPVAEHCSTPTAQPPHSRQLPLGAPSSCCSAPRQLLTAPQPPSPRCNSPAVLRRLPPRRPRAAVVYGPGAVLGCAVPRQGQRSGSSGLTSAGEVTGAGGGRNDVGMVCRGGGLGSQGQHQLAAEGRLMQTAQQGRPAANHPTGAFCTLCWTTVPQICRNPAHNRPSAKPKLARSYEPSRRAADLTNGMDAQQGAGQSIRAAGAGGSGGSGQGGGGAAQRAAGLPVSCAAAGNSDTEDGRRE